MQSFSYMLYSNQEVSIVKKKTAKIIIICVFLALIIATAFIFGSLAIESYRYDIENEVDVLGGFGAVIAINIGIGVIIYELDLLYTILYFFIKRKTKTKTILNFASHFTLILMFLGEIISDFLNKHLNILKEDWILTVVLFWCYVFIRLIYFFILLEDSLKEM